LLPHFIARICGFHLFSNFTCATWYNKSFTSNTNRWHTSLKSRAWLEWNYYMCPLLLKQACYFMNLRVWEWVGEHEQINKTESFFKYYTHVDKIFEKYFDA
jgi:hypothetical protein